MVDKDGTTRGRKDPTKSDGIPGSLFYKPYVHVVLVLLLAFKSAPGPI